MLIEITGCTGAGKTTISNLVLKNLLSSNVNAKLIDVGGKLRFDLIVFPWFLWFAIRHFEFCRVTLQSLIRDADTKFNAFNIYRNFSKKIGTYHMLKTCLDRQVIVWDEGTVHAMHNLFVHVNSVPKDSDIIKFAHCIPKPDLLVYVRAPFEVIVSRTISRGHRRVGNNETDIRTFIANAIASFEFLTKMDVIKERLLVVDNADSTLQKPQNIANFISTYILSNTLRFG